MAFLSFAGLVLFELDGFDSGANLFYLIANPAILLYVFKDLDASE